MFVIISILTKCINFNIEFTILFFTILNGTIGNNLFQSCNTFEIDLNTINCFISSEIAERFVLFFVQSYFRL